MSMVADRARLLECVHCGLCLPACPTYLELGTEADSPRGRIYLMRGLEERTLAPAAEVIRHLDLCLGCRACETACPSGVQYGALLESTREWMERAVPRSGWKGWRTRLVLGLFPNRKRLALLSRFARALQSAGIWRLARMLSRTARLLPELAPAEPLPVLSPPVGPARARVGLLAGCVADELCPEANRAAVRVLARTGNTVVVPREQGCCGALHLHAGAVGHARALARRNVYAFDDSLDAIVVTAAGCGAVMKDYGRLMKDDPTCAARAARFAARVRDVTEYLAAGSLPVSGRLPLRVAYHDACHLAHAQGIRAEPRALLRHIPGVELVDLAESDVCCGSAGSYNLTEPDMAERLARRKVEHIIASGADCVATANPGCALQIRAALRARGMTTRVAHPVELIAEALECATAAAE